ncbi:MAG: COX15/CtaA family protein, partial [Planctomycetota bacterium]
FVPSAYFVGAPRVSDAFETIAAVQFNHRILGYLAVLLGLAWAIRCRYARHSGLRLWSGLVALGMLGQTALGVATVMHAAPLEWAIAHQGGALILWALTLRAVFETGWPSEERIART